MNEQPQKIDLSNIDWRSSREFFESLRGDFQRLEDTTETYDFTWVGKKNAILEAGAPINKTLRPDLENSKNWDETENLFIEGDNLEALKLLQNSYLGKIKMIYIDPPYNTGKDFVYHDNFRQNVEEYDDSVERIDADGNQNFKKNTRDSGRFHSDWLNMMFPRLKLAKNLLSEDGVIFISIDDNEQANLKKLCDEVFGDENTEVFIWNKEADGSSGTLKQTSTIRRTHEYIIAAYKNYGSVQFVKIREALSGKEHELHTANLAVNSSNERSDHRNYFTIRNPSGDTFTRQWKWGKSEIDRLIKEGLIYWGSDGHKQPRLIIPTDDRRTTFLRSILNYGGTTIGRKDFEVLMGNKVDFSYPKPVILLSKLIGTASSSSGIILDFFAGSATTADAVMQLNAEDGGNRKFIMVQLPEETDEKSEAFKAGYKTIPEISRERIRRAGNKIAAENPNAKLDIGFRALKIDSSNQRDVSKTTEEISQANLLDDAENIKDDRNQFDLLYGFLLASGMELSSKFEIEKVSGKDVLTYDYLGEGTGVVACFEKTNSEIIEKIAHKQPLVAVFRDSMFETSQEKINLMQQIKAVSPETEVKVV